MPMDQFDGSIDCPWHGRQLIFQTKRPWPQQRWQKQRKAELLCAILLRTERRKNEKYGATDIRRMQTLWSVLSKGWYHSSLQPQHAKPIKTSSHLLTAALREIKPWNCSKCRQSDHPEIHPIVWWAMVVALFQGHNSLTLPDQSAEDCSMIGTTHVRFVFFSFFWQSWDM